MTASLPRKTLATCWRQTTTFEQADFMASEHLMLMDHLMAYHVLLCWEQWLVVLQAKNTLCIGYIQYLCIPQYMTLKYIVCPNIDLLWKHNFLIEQKLGYGRREICQVKSQYDECQIDAYGMSSSL